MGCSPSTTRLQSGGRGRRLSCVTPWVAVFVPSLWVPVPVDIERPLRGLVPRVVAEKMSKLRGKIVLLAEQKNVSLACEMRQLLEEYLPILLGLTTKGHHLDALVEFKWKNIECDGQEACFSSAWFEILSVVHMMAMLCLVEANAFLLSNSSSKQCEVNVTEESIDTSVHLLLRSAGYLDCCLQHIVVHLPLEIRQGLPNSLSDIVLEAISIQTLGQALEIQLGFATENNRTTLSVKRRMACEEASCYAQALYCLSGAIDDACVRKHLLFNKWKFLEAKAAAYYYSGMLLDGSNRTNSHIDAVNCFLASDDLLRKIKIASLSFCLASPVTKVPPAWGVIKDLRRKVPEVASQKYQMYGYLLEQDKDLQSPPDLPEIPLSLQADKYDLPPIDESWNDEDIVPARQSLKEHLADDEDLEGVC